MQTPEAVDLDKCSMGFDQVREGKQKQTALMLQPYELDHEMLRNSLL